MCKDAKEALRNFLAQQLRDVEDDNEELSIGLHRLDRNINMRLGWPKKCKSSARHSLFAFR
jgi:hypothetical protein